MKSARSHLLHPIHVCSPLRADLEEQTALIQNDMRTHLGSKIDSAREEYRARHIVLQRWQPYLYKGAVLVVSERLVMRHLAWGRGAMLELGLGIHQVQL